MFPIYNTSRHDWRLNPCILWVPSTGRNRTCHRTTWDTALQWRHTCVLLVYWLYDYSVSSHCTPFRCRAAHENKLEGSIFGLTRYFRWQNFRWPGQLGTSLQIITVSTKRQCLDFRPTCLVGGMDPKNVRELGSSSHVGWKIEDKKVCIWSLKHFEIANQFASRTTGIDLATSNNALLKPSLLDLSVPSRLQGFFWTLEGLNALARKKIPVHDQKQCCTIRMRSLPPSPSLYMGRRTQTATWAKSCRPADFEGINWDQFQWCYHCWSSQSPVHPPSFRCFGSNWPYPWILAVEFTMFQSVEKNRLFSHILFDVDDTVRFRRLAPHVSLA